MIVECCMCNMELVIENVSLCDGSCLVRVWPCESCQEEVAELVQEMVNE